MAILNADDAEFDAHIAVAVIGAGACGMTAALAAASAGAEVLVLERDATPAGTTSMSQGFVCAAGTDAQRALGIDDGADLMFDDIMRKTRGATDPRLARTVAAQSGPTIDWLTRHHDLAFTVEPRWRTDFGHSRPRLHGLPSRTGGELLGALLRAAERQGVGLSTSAHVVDLYADADGRVTGLALERPGGARETLGCDALVLATCGFGANRAMIRRFIPEMADGPYFGHEGDDGAGIDWGMGLGAATADMAAYQGYGALAREQGVLVNYNIVMEGGIEVNAEGRRFSHELSDISGQSLKVLAQPGQVAWVVYDERLHLAALDWHEYRQLNALGALRQAPDAAALAALIHVPAAALTETVASIRGFAAGAGTDPFGRDFTRDPPLGAPLYAVKVTGALFHTQGGLVVDEGAAVCRPDGTRLPNLFAGGGAARSISGPGVWGYLPAAGLCMALTLGRLAGESVARLVAG